ncbi:MAG: UDP-N-acetylenolpyruvoylglucosamine reductase, partial [Balneolaceae bacterium]|nr:UDP-N-acetylenolpyruvoylglucosamine reductase [Balneolaceae bacterium]
GTYKNQALVLVNHGGATGEELWNHAVRIQQSVSEKFGVELTPEVNIIE